MLTTKIYRSSLVCTILFIPNLATFINRIATIAYKTFSHSNYLCKQQPLLIRYFSNYYYLDHGHEIKHEDPSLRILAPNTNTSKQRQSFGEKNGFVISPDNRFLTLKWRDDATDNHFHSLWLRRECHCSKCMVLGAKQYKVTSDSLLPPVILERVTLDEEWLQLTWRQRDGELHEGRIPLQWLYYNRKSLKTPNGIKAPGRDYVMKEFDYNSVMSSKQKFYEYLYQINEAGVAIVNGAPNDGLKPYAELISHTYECCWGKDFDVKARNDDLHLAYTDSGLPFHLDLPYYQHYAGLQHLHCIENSTCVEGGILILKDIFQMASKFRTDFPEHFKTMSETKLCFDNINLNRDDPTFLRFYDKNITLDENGEIVKINWNPFHQGPLSENSDGGVLEQYFTAFAAFDKYLINFPSIIEVQFKPGKIVSFHNTRIAHGRTRTKLNGGVRHLKGCYTPLDEYRSKLRYMCFIMGKEQPTKVW